MGTSLIIIVPEMTLKAVLYTKITQLLNNNTNIHTKKYIITL